MRADADAPGEVATRPGGSHSPVHESDEGVRVARERERVAAEREHIAEEREAGPDRANRASKGKAD